MQLLIEDGAGMMVVFLVYHSQMDKANNFATGAVTTRTTAGPGEKVPAGMRTMKLVPEQTSLYIRKRAEGEQNKTSCKLVKSVVTRTLVQ